MEFNFGKRNYQLMIVGVLFIILGYFLMSGGKSEDPAVFNPEIFSTTRITLSIISIIIGMAIEVVAILYKDKNA
ncbi:MAG: DUF3098 domain-containing protein [Flavobacteriales bacterium]|jgi:hypothetical protein|tara:strand:- start:33419 stop:33640 length:222 start_codon:yes stop_codon:yes gene_type:complete